MKRQVEASPKKVLLVLPEAFNSAGGIQIFCRALCLAAGRWAEDRGASLSALVLNDAGAPDPRYINGGFDSYVGSGRSKVKFVKQFLRQVATSRYDMILFGHVLLAPLALVARSLNAAKRIGVVTYGIEVWRPLTKLQRMGLRQADVVLAISDYTRDELIRHGSATAEKIQLFPCSLDPFWTIEGGEPTAQKAPPMLLTVCRLASYETYKGVDSVIESLPAVVRECGPVDYRVVGSGDDIPRLKELAERLSVSQYVTFAGGVGEEELRDYYRRCSLFVMPSEKEGFGIVFLEAMAYAKPVIGGAHGGTPSVVKDKESGLLVGRMDVEGISRAVINLLSDDELRGSLGKAGRKRLINEFTFQKFESNFNELINSST